VHLATFGAGLMILGGSVLWILLSPNRDHPEITRATSVPFLVLAAIGVLLSIWIVGDLFYRRAKARKLALKIARHFVNPLRTPENSRRAD
jgi:hypothetical protein